MSERDGKTDFTRDDWEMWNAGFHGYEGCPLLNIGGCRTPFHCSEAMDCPVRSSRTREEPEDAPAIEAAYRRFLQRSHLDPHREPGMRVAFEDGYRAGQSNDGAFTYSEVAKRKDAQ